MEILWIVVGVVVGAVGVGALVMWLIKRAIHHAIGQGLNW